MATCLARSLCAYSRIACRVRPSMKLPKMAGSAWRRRALPSTILATRKYSNEPGEGFKFTESHEWALLEGNKVTVGITDYAQDKLGTIVFVELPDVGAELSKGDQLGVLESVKAAADIYSPVSGTVVEVNSQLEDEPEWINQEPYKKGWIAKLDVSDSSEYKKLLSKEDYDKLLSDSI